MTLNFGAKNEPATYWPSGDCDCGPETPCRQDVSGTCNPTTWCDVLGLGLGLGLHPNANANANADPNPNPHQVRRVLRDGRVRAGGELRGLRGSRRRRPGELLRARLDDVHAPRVLPR